MTAVTSDATLHSIFLYIVIHISSQYKKAFYHPYRFSDSARDDLETISGTPHRHSKPLKTQNQIHLKKTKKYLLHDGWLALSPDTQTDCKHTSFMVQAEFHLCLFFGFSANPLPTAAA
jgi:hypothetical protein